MIEQDFSGIQVDKLLVAGLRGFCAGVVRAIDVVEKALEVVDGPVYVRKEIIHNRYVVDELREKGARFVEEVDEVPDDAALIFSAHGIAPAIRDMAQRKKLRTIDATCPLVTKVHLEAIHYARQGYTIILVGHHDHDETVGTLGEAPAAIRLVETKEDAETVTVPDPDRVAYLTQTTLSIDDTREILAILKQRFPNLRAPSKQDICYATQNRQDAVKAMAPHVDMLLVLGAPNSSNSLRMCEVARANGVASHLIERAQDIRPEWLRGVKVLGLTASASAPEILVQEVVAFSPRAPRCPVGGRIRNGQGGRLLSAAPGAQGAPSRQGFVVTGNLDTVFGVPYESAGRARRDRQRNTRADPAAPEGRAGAAPRTAARPVRGRSRDPRRHRRGGGWGAVSANLARIGGWFFALCGLYAAAQIAFALGWWVLTGPRPRPVSFGALFAAYLGGDSINYFTSVGGEPVKADLLKTKLGFSRRSRHGGGSPACGRARPVDLPDGRRRRRPVALRSSPGGPRGRHREPARARARRLRDDVGPAPRSLPPDDRVARRFRFLARRIGRLEEAAGRLDERIGEFYSEKMGHFGAAVAWCFLGWCGGLVETWIVLRLLSPAHDFSTAVAIESLAMVLNNILLFIPGRVGSAEGVRIGVYALVGLTTAQGAAYALVRRGRELVWLVPGFIVLLKRHVLGIGHWHVTETKLSEGTVR